MMIPIRDLFETHLTVRDLQRSMAFYGDKLGLKLARVFPDRKVAFYWMGSPGASMLGLRPAPDCMIDAFTLVEAVSGRYDVLQRYPARH